MAQKMFLQIFFSVYKNSENDGQGVYESLDGYGIFKVHKYLTSREAQQRTGKLHVPLLKSTHLFVSGLDVLGNANFFLKLINSDGKVIF